MGVLNEKRCNTGKLPSSVFNLFTNVVVSDKILSSPFGKPDNSLNLLKLV